MATIASSSCERCSSHGQPTVVLKHSNGSVCEIHEHGATVTRYATAQGSEILWFSSGAVFNGAKAIRGGIPVVFPIFGPAPGDNRVGLVGEPLPQHGFARTSKWTVVSAAADAETGQCSAVFRLDSSPETLKSWPHAFSLEYTVVLDEGSLHCSLKATNLDKEAAVSPQALLHTYFRTSDVTDVLVHGLEGVGYADSADGKKPKKEENPAVRFAGEVDRVYDSKTRTEEPIMLRDPGAPATRVEARVTSLDAADTVTAEEAADVVVWNPHIQKAAAMSDFDDDGWKNMFCVEPGFVGPDRPSIRPDGHSLVLSQTITPMA